MVWRVGPGSGDGPRPAASKGGVPRHCEAATSAGRRLWGGRGAGTGDLPGPSHSPPLWEEGRKEGGLYSVLKSSILPRTRCTNLAWYLILCNQSAIARQRPRASHISSIARAWTVELPLLPCWLWSSSPLLSLLPDTIPPFLFLPRVWALGAQNPPPLILGSG